MSGSRVLYEALYKDKKIPGQALLVDIDDGVATITGCSHPGVEVFTSIARGIFRSRKLKALIGNGFYREKDGRGRKHAKNG